MGGTLIRAAAGLYVSPTDTPGGARAMDFLHPRPQSSDPRDLQKCTPTSSPHSVLRS